MHIRNANIADLPQIVAIYNSTIASGIVTADTDPVTVESRMQWFHQHDPASRPLWVATSPEHDGIIGWLSFNDFYGRPAYNITSEISLYIHEDCRGKGFGKAMLQHAIAKAPELGLQQLLGFIFAENKESISLFQKNGFQIWGEMRDIAIINNQHLSLLIMGLKIESSHSN